MEAAKIIELLNQEPEMNPDLHDGSYELMREIVESYSNLSDYSVINYKDLNAVYAMAIGTWKLNVEKKKEYVNAGHLSEDEKETMADVIDDVWDKACRGKYSNREGNKPSIGMFGTGFYSFERSADDESCQRFIELLVDLADMEDDAQMFARVEKVFDQRFRGMQAAAASVMLHCLKPYTFPILNANFGSGTIYSRLGIDIDQEGRLITYVKNCRRIRAFRDTTLKIKNYRIMDLLAHKLNLANDNNYIPSMDEYDPGISKEQYIDLFQNSDAINRNCLDTIYYIYLMGGEATCTAIADNYGSNPQHYSVHATTVAKAVQIATECVLSEREDGPARYWSILFIGKHLDSTHFSWKLREPLYEAVEELEGSGFFEYLSSNDGEEDDEEDVTMSLNTILYGPPGTGKTYNTVIYAVSIVENKSYEDIQYEAEIDYKSVKNRFDEYKSLGRIAFTTFHQSYGYEEFIEGIKPVMDDSETELGYTIEDGVFKAFCKKASIPSETNDQSALGFNDNDLKTVDKSSVFEENPIIFDDNYVFIIDEINRGNISKIFGELITLVEETKRIGAAEEMKVELPYSHHSFGVPKNVYILGTMNTADRTIAIMDTALRRRFSFIEMLPDSGILRNYWNNPVVMQDGYSVNVADMLDIINDRITFLYDREHTIGHAFFSELRRNPTVETLATIFEKSIIPLLQEYFYEDYEKIQLVLGDDGKTGDNAQFKFISDAELVASDIFETEPEYESVKKYSINYDAFLRIESYKLISKKL